MTSILWCGFKSVKCKLKMASQIPKTLHIDRWRKKKYSAAFHPKINIEMVHLDLGRFLESCKECAKCAATADRVDLLPQSLTFQVRPR